MSLKGSSAKLRVGPVAPYQFANEQQPFPVDAFPRIMEKAIADVHRVDQAPIEVVAMGALAVVSIALQDRIDVVRLNQAPSPVSLNLLNISKSGDGKTIVEKNFLSIIADFEKESLKKQSIRQDAIERELSFLERKRKNLGARIGRPTKRGPSPDDLEEEWYALHEKIEALEDAKSSQPQWLFSEGSYEGLRRVLEGEGRAIGVVSFDAGAVLNGMLTTNPTQLNNLWDGKGIVAPLASGTSRAHDPRLTMLLATQPSELQAFLDKPRGGRALGNGFFARFLYAESTPVMVQISTERKATPGVDAFKERLRTILEAPDTGTRQNIRMNERAAEYWASYFNTLRQVESQTPWVEEISGFVRKLPEQAARIAALFQCVEGYGDIWSPAWSGPIDERTMRKAVQLCDWFMHSYRAGFSEDGEARKKKVESIAEKVLGKIRDKYEEKKTLGQYAHPPEFDRNYRVKGVEPGAFFTWNGWTWVITYTQQQIHNYLHDCDYNLLTEALNFLEASGKIYLAKGPKDGKVVLYVGPPYTPQQSPRNWTELLPLSIHHRANVF